MHPILAHQNTHLTMTVPIQESTSISIPKRTVFEQVNSQGYSITEQDWVSVIHPALEEYFDTIEDTEELSGIIIFYITRLSQFCARFVKPYVFSDCIPEMWKCYFVKSLKKKEILEEVSTKIHDYFSVIFQE